MKSVWTSEEEEILKANYPKMDIKEVAKLLPKKTINGIRNKALRMNISSGRYYSEAEAEYVRKKYPKKGAAWVAKKLGRSYESVRTWAGMHGLKYRHWTDEEIEYLKNNSDKSNKEIAKRLGKTKYAVASARLRHKTGTHVDNMDGITLVEAERLIGVPRGTLWHPFTHKYKSRKSGYFRVITFEELERFMQENPHRWDATRTEKEYFMQYEWFRKKRQADLQRMRERRAQ